MSELQPLSNPYNFNDKFDEHVAYAEGVMDERNRLVELLGENSMTMSDNTVRVFIMKEEDWLMLKGKSDAVK